MNYFDEASKLANKVAQATEASILAQLNEFIKRDLIVVEQTKPIFVMDYETNQLVVKTSVSLKLKDQDYIEKLERENKSLKEAHAKIQEWASLTFGKDKG